MTTTLPFSLEICSECWGCGWDCEGDCPRCEGSGDVYTEAERERRRLLEQTERNPERLLNPADERLAELRAMSYSDYLWTLEWRERRGFHLRQANFTCDRCHFHTRKYRELHVHHKTYERFGREDRDDLEVLCAECHRREHGIGA